MIALPDSDSGIQAVGSSRAAKTAFAHMMSVQRFQSSAGHVKPTGQQAVIIDCVRTNGKAVTPKDSS